MSRETTHRILFSAIETMRSLGMERDVAIEIARRLLYLLMEGE